MNYQYRFGGTLSSSLKELWSEGGIGRLYQGLPFAIVQGHRLPWWRSARDFDNGELPEGRLFLSGHAGLATPSPLEMRTFSQEEMKLVIAIFGRGTTGQERVTILAPSEDSKENLENTILNLPRKDE